MNIYDFDTEFEELMDRALNELPPSLFDMFLDHVDQIVAEYQD